MQDCGGDSAQLPRPPTLVPSEFLSATAVASCMPVIHTCCSWAFRVWNRCSEVGEITWVGGASTGVSGSFILVLECSCKCSGFECVTGITHSTVCDTLSLPSPTPLPHPSPYPEAEVSVDEVWCAGFGGAEEEVLQWAWLRQALLLDHQLPQRPVYHTVLGGEGRGRGGEGGEGRGGEGDKVTISIVPGNSFHTGKKPRVLFTKTHVDPLAQILQ